MKPEKYFKKCHPLHINDLQMVYIPARNNDFSFFKGYAFAFEWHTFAKGHTCAPNMGSWAMSWQKNIIKLEHVIWAWVYTYTTTDLISFVKLSGWKCNIVSVYFVEFRFQFLQPKKCKTPWPHTPPSGWITWKFEKGQIELKILLFNEPSNIQ